MSSRAIGFLKGQVHSSTLFGAKGDRIRGTGLRTGALAPAPGDGKFEIADASQADGWRGGYPSTVYSQCGQNASIAPTTSDVSLFASLLALPTRIAAGDRIEIEVIFTLLNNSASGRVYTPNVKIGSTTVFNAATAGVTNSSTARLCRLFVAILCTATNAQRVFTDLDLGAASTTGPGYNFGNRGLGTAAEDLTVAKNFDFLIQSAAVTATQTAQIDQATIRHIPAKLI